MKPIYLYHLTQNGQIRYVGVTTQLDIRKSFWKRTKPPHEFEIIDTFSDKEEAGIAEQYHIAGYRTYKDGWNKSIGGEKLLSGKDNPSYIDGRTYDMKAYKKAHSATPEQKLKRKTYRETPEAKAKAKEKMKEYMREYHARPEVIARKQEYDKLFHLNNPEYMKEYHKKYGQKPEVKERNREKSRAYYHRKKALAIT